MDAADWDRRYAGSDLVWSVAPNRWVAAEAADLAPGRALDLACGEGRNAVWLAERGWGVTGVDFSAVALDSARRVARERGATVEWVLADLVTYVPEAASADLVVVAYLHLPAAGRDAVLGRIPAALAPGGVAVVVGHDRENLDRGHGGPRDPAVLTTPEEVVAAMPGLVVERAGRVERGLDTPDGRRVAVDTLVRVRRPA